MAMDSQIGDPNVNIYFVISEQYKSEQECSDDMWQAFNKCDEYSAEPKWISEAECLKMNPVKSDVFVMEDFTGKTFKALQQFKCLILGPRCLLSCMVTGEPLPEGTSPVLNVAMKNMLVTISGFSATEKEEMKTMVEYMGGLYTKQLRSCVTHLVTNSVITAKYEAAVKSGKTVVIADWVKSIWTANLKEFVSATDLKFDRYKCPVFWNLVVTSTNLTKDKKNEVKDLINSNGGEFLGVLDGSKVKLVFTTEKCSATEKLKFAMQQKIPCLRHEWVADSVRAGYALPWEGYIIQSLRTCSTPEKSVDQAALNWSTISVIRNEDNANAIIQETMMSTRSTMNFAPESFRAPCNIVSEVTVVEKLDLIQAKKAGPFLDGCNIYLAGFPTHHRDKLNKIISVGSATRLDEPSEALTHVIVGDAYKASADLKIIRSKELSPYIVNVQWLLESIKLRRPAQENSFSLEQKDTLRRKPAEPSSPLSKKNLEMMQRSNVSLTSSASSSIRNLSMRDSGIRNDDESDLVMKYLQNSSNSIKINSEEQTTSEKSHSSSFESRPSTSKINETSQVEQPTNLSAIPLSQSCDQNIFTGLRFFVAKLETEEMEIVTTSIKVQGGEVLLSQSSRMVDFAVVPFNSTLKCHAKNIVTSLYIEECAENNSLVKIEYYHKPVTIQLEKKPLKDCVIAMSTYTDTRREYFQKLIELLGARYQDTFARSMKKDKSGQDVYINTHLVCPSPQGKKYSAAIKWKVPAVTCDWLLACLKEMQHVDELPFLVGESTALEKDKSHEGTLVANQDTLKVLETVQLQQNTEMTPKNIVNKRLTAVTNKGTPMIQSPFHMDTPTSPYGRIFGDENPSPATRKYWLKWSEQFPDMQSPHVKKDKRVSTPLSELKKRLLEKCVKESEIDVAMGRNVSIEKDLFSTETSSKRKLSYTEEIDSPVKNAKVDDLQMEELKSALRNASNLRESLSAENIKRLNTGELDNADKFAVMDTQVDTVGWENLDRIPFSGTSGTGSNISSEESKKRKFMLSGLKDRQFLEDIIVKLGGEVSDLPYFDMDATHLLCLKPGRNEKMLGSIASGKWILHTNYLTDCNQAGKFLDEEEYEFGNPRSQGKIPELSSEGEKSTAKAAHRWRLTLNTSEGKKDGAFQDMVAILLVHREKYSQFERLILAGGGVVVEARPPYDVTYCGRKITHCFVQPKQFEQKIEWAMLASKDILCFPPQFLGDHLTSETPPNPRDCVLPEFRKYFSLVPS